MDTCTYEPTETFNYYDRDDIEHETNWPDYDCGSFMCDKCNYEMLYGGDYSWFDEEPPYKPHFKYCPNCGRRVIPMEPYDRAVE